MRNSAQQNNKSRKKGRRKRKIDFKYYNFYKLSIRIIRRIMLWEFLATNIENIGAVKFVMRNISSLSTANVNKRIASASKAQTVDTIDLSPSSRYAELLLSSALLLDVSYYYANKTRAEALSLSREKRYSYYPRAERFEMPPCISISNELFLAKLVFAMQMQRSPRLMKILKHRSLSKVFPTSDHRGYPSLPLSQNRNVGNDR